MATAHWIQAPVSNQTQWANLNYIYTTTSTTMTSYGLPNITSSNATVWQYWNSSGFSQTTPFIISGTSLNNVSWASWNERYTETQEEQLAREVRETRWRQRQEALGRRRKRQRAAADTLAENLLMACLSRQQAKDHLAHGWFDVISSLGRTFRIFTRTSVYGGRSGGQSGNVVLLDAEGRQEARYCVHPPDGLPHADAWLAQKLALEADEDSVMAVANLPWRRQGHADIRPAARERHLRLVPAAA